MDDTLVEKLDKVTDNKSEYIRQAIIEKMGAQDSIQEMYLKIDKMKLELQNYDDLITERVDKIIKEKQQHTIAELQSIEDRAKEKELKQAEFMQKWAFLEEIDSVKNFAYVDGWDATPNLISIVESLRASGHRIGVVQMRDYLSLRKH